MVVKVVINVSSSNVDQEYTYLLPKELETTTKVGARVIVGFGSSNRLVMGYIVDICPDTTYGGSLKEIEQVLDYEPLISAAQIELAKKIRDDTICPLVRIFNLMLPNALIVKTSKYLTLINYQAVDERIARLFSNSDTILYTKTLWPLDSTIAKEVKHNNILVSYEAKPKTKVKTVNKYLINSVFTYANRNTLRSEKQREFLHNIENEIAMTAMELSEKYEIHEGMIQSLWKKGFLDKIEEPVSRIVVRDIPIHKKIRETKNQNITKVLENVESIEKPLLYIPKDEDEQFETIYQVINKYQKNNQNVVVIVPEILTSYRVSHLIRKRTGLSVGLINSKLPMGELLDEFYAIKENKYTIFVTTSIGALFPYQNVGAFILLNVESDNYYPDQSPRYNLKQVMIEYGKSIQAKTILISFIPSILDYTYGLQNYYEIIENINEKNIDIEVVDFKKELRSGNNSPLSHALHQAIMEDVKNKKLTMMIVNNKSYSSYVQCRSCGNTIVCPKCQLSLQYNKKNNVLICPSCSYRVPFHAECEICHGNDFKMGGIGMEKVEEIIRKEYPHLHVKILKESSYDEYYQTMSEIDEGELNILITSSMLFSSLDTDSLGTVALLNLDSVAKAATYDANERAYALLVQAKMKIISLEKGKLIVQTYNPEDAYLKDFLINDYHGFLKHELEIRRILKNEPFYYINRIIVKGKYETIFKEANDIKKNLQNMLGNHIFVIGPTYNYQYQGVQIMIKHRLNDIGRFYKIIYEKYQTTSTTVIVDRYPKYI